MDFGTLLHVAKKNSESSKNEGKYYSTKYAPPKKESKESKQLSNNIQRFLQKRDQEEKERMRKDKEKLDSLLAMRDEKSKNKIRKMLKVTKSANKSVLDDAIDTEHTAVTMEGPEQPDQDDYGYVSNAANDFYQKYMEKVKDVKEDKGFAPSRPQSLRDLSGTKERVKAAITKEIEDKKNPTRQRSSTSTSINSTSSLPYKDSSSSISRAYTTSKPLYDPEAERREEERKKREDEQKRSKNRKPAPPPLDFQALLKLAAKKQHEPIEILPEVKKKKEPERLLTSKERREMEERQRAKEAREERRKEKIRAAEAGSSKDRKDSAPAVRMEPNGRIPKLNQATTKASTASSAASSTNRGGNSALSTKSIQSNTGNNGVKKPTNPATSMSLSSSSSISKNPTSSHSKSTPSTVSAKPNISAAVASSSASTKPSTSASALNSSKNPYGSTSSNSGKNAYNGPTREFPPRDIKSIKPRQFPPPDVQKTRQFPPADVRRPVGNSRPGDSRKSTAASKRRILDDDDEDEYDSELDDFIDDGDCEEDISSHIKAIFGYDKSKYRGLDEDDDDAAMESNFAQVQREEYISKKIGIQEDLEDMKLEAIEKKRKMMLKKRRL